MAYQEITKYNSPNYTPYNQVPYVFGMSRTIDGVTFHWWGDPINKPTYNGVINWLCRPNGTSSANAVGEGNGSGGRVAWIIDAQNAAWHAGHARGNATTVGYECNPRLSNEDYNTMGEFLYDMERAYGRRLAVYVHKDWIPTQCSPIDKNRVRQIADRLHSGKPTVTEAQIKEAFRSILEREVDANGLKHYMNQAKGGWTIDRIKQDLMNSGEKKELERKKRLAAEEAKRKKDWRNNLKDFDKTLYVLPAKGTQVYDFTKGLPVNDKIIPKGTAISVKKKGFI